MFEKTIETYRKCIVSVETVAKNIHIGDPSLIPKVILSVSPCRSGTTVMLRIFASAGIESHFQELKNVFRWHLQGEHGSWELPKKAGHTLYLKETIGPFLPEEARFNPMDVLLKAGYPVNKLQILLIVREPLETWASWVHWWREVTRLDYFIAAFETTEKIRNQAAVAGIPVTMLAYETFQHNLPKTVIRQLFTRLQIPCSIPFAIDKWDKLPPFGETGSNIILPDEPPVFVTPHIHEQPHYARRFEYSNRQNRISGLNPVDINRITDAGLPELYKTWKNICQKDLSLK